MECKNIQHSLIDFIEGNISLETKLQIEEHLLNCKTCRTEHKQTRQLLEDMQMLENEQADEELKENFYNMLEQEKEAIAANQSDSKIKSIHSKFNWNYLRYAASAIILLSIGFFFGHNLQLSTQQSTEIASLRSELYAVQQTATLTSLSQATASQRLNAINIINDQVKSNEKTINTLINTFRNDENINVRMAAANALVKYSESEEVRNVFIDVLDKEKDPALQITLIHLLTQIQDQRAKKTFEKIVTNNNTIPVVKEQAQEGLKVFI